VDFEKNSHVLKALAHPIRLKMATMLLDDECCVTDVTNALGISQSTSSQHLGILKNAGVLSPQRYGTKTCYVVNNELVKKLILLLKETS
jgi:ArsR family transcriptional regulator